MINNQSFKSNSHKKKNVTRNEDLQLTTTPMFVLKPRTYAIGRSII